MQNPIETIASSQTAEAYNSDVIQMAATQQPVNMVRRSFYSEAGYQKKSDSPEWDEVLASMAAEIKVRHYSRKTLKTYANWSRKFQRFLNNKSPGELTTADVKDYLTHLAVKCRVASTTQNQAFNSLLFLFRHGLKRELGELRDVPRAKKSLYIPTVLSRDEIDVIIGHLSPIPLIWSENCCLGVGCDSLNAYSYGYGISILMRGSLSIHGKGKKDRTVPIPEAILPELKAQIKMIGELHDRDLSAGYDGGVLDDAVEKNIRERRRSSPINGFSPRKT